MRNIDSAEGGESLLISDARRGKKGLTALIILTTRQTNFNDCSKSLNRITRMFIFPEQNIIIHLAILYFLNFAERSY